MELAETVGRHLRALRAYQGMTQLEVATRAGITPSYLSLIESGKRDVSVGTLAKLAAILGGNVDFGLYPLSGTPVMEDVVAPYTMDDLKRDGLGSASQSIPYDWETVMAEYEASYQNDKAPPSVTWDETP